MAAASSRDPLADITNTVSVSAHRQQSSKPAAVSNNNLRKPKLLRQTSLFAFAARQSSPACSLSSDDPLPNASTPAKSHPDDGYLSASVPTSSSSSPDSIVNTSNKRQRLDDTFPSSNHASHSRSHIQDERAESVDPVDPVREERRAKLRLRNQRGIHATTKNFSDHLRLSEYATTSLGHRLAEGMTRRGQASTISRNHWDLISHDTGDVHRCVSNRPNRDYAPPFACAFSNASKKGGRKILAVADEEGTVSLLDAHQTAQYGAPTIKSSFQAHNNAIFDLRWSNDDKLIATGSGDQTAILTDVETKKVTATFAAHTCSIKQIQFDPFNNNLLSTASRDGSIAIWDQRVNAQKNGNLAPVNHIRFAHDSFAKTRKLKEETRSCTRSVTCIVYLQHKENLLASGGSYDGIVKVWDLRKAVSRRINPPSVEESLDFTGSSAAPCSTDLPSSSAMSASSSFTGRSHGIASLILSPDGARLYSLNTNSKIYVHDALFPSRNLAKPMQVMTGPSLMSSSFYVRLAISADGNTLAAGSCGKKYGVTLFDIATHKKGMQPFTEQQAGEFTLYGHQAEVGCLDWADDTLATCSDDLLTRFWRPNQLVRSKIATGYMVEKDIYSKAERLRRPPFPGLYL